MGAPMAANLVKSGHHISGFDVLPASREASAKDGVQIVANARSTVENADVVVTMLPARRARAVGLEGYFAGREPGRAAHRLFDHRRGERAPSKSA